MGVTPTPSADGIVCVAVLAGEEGAELEEEEVDEEEEESGNLDEEEMKKMQSDEVCRDSPSPSAISTVESCRQDGAVSLGPVLSSSPCSAPFLRAPRAWR